MSRILVQPSNPRDVRPEELGSLVDALRDRGMDARIAYLEQQGYGVVTWWEVVTIWVGLDVSQAVINQIVALATEWMKNRFRSNPENQRPKVTCIVLYEGDEGRVSECIEVMSPGSEPVRTPPAESETYTRIKPPEAENPHSPGPIG